MLVRFVYVSSAALLLAASASAQWVSFSDDTAARLQLQSFADNPAGNPLNDDEEKDIFVADLDRDGDDDVIVVRKEPFSNPGARQDVLLMNEGGVLVDRTATLAPEFLTALTDSRDVFVADFTGDQWPDVAIANTFGQQPFFYRNLGDGGGGPWLGLADESFRLPTLVSPGDAATILFCAIWAGDVTGNGALDIYLSNYDPSLGGTNDILFINDGAGNFTNETAARLGNNANVAFGTGVEIHDVDNDGDQDIVKITTLYAEPPFNIGQYILWNDGSGVFDTLPVQQLPADSPYMLTLGHLDDNGMLDYLLQGDVQDRVALTTAIDPDTQLTFATSDLTSQRTSGFGGNTKLYDIDGDGDLDGAIGPIDTDIQNCGVGAQLALLRNEGSGTLTDPWPLNQPQNFHTDAHDFGFLDLNADGCTDLLLANCVGWDVLIQDDCQGGGTVEVPLSRLRVVGGDLAGGDLASLAASDDDRVMIDAVDGGSQHQASVMVLASSPVNPITSLDLTVEFQTSATPVRLKVLVRNWDTGSWDTVATIAGGTTDAVHVLSDIAMPDAHVRDADGRVQVRFDAVARNSQLPTGFQLGIDQVLVEVGE